jgi:hypothetical protein
MLLSEEVAKRLIGNFPPKVSNLIAGISVESEVGKSDRSTSIRISGYSACCPDAVRYKAGTGLAATL